METQNVTDLNRIRSVKTLDEMRAVLMAFIVRIDILPIYLNEYQWGEEDYEADIETAKELLEKVERRMASLSHHLTKKPVKVKREIQRLDGTESPTVSQVL